MSTVKRPAIALVGAPGVGKSTLSPLVAKLITERKSLCISCDNEVFGMLPESRIQLANSLGYSNPDDAEFRASVGRTILIDTVQSIGKHMEQFPADTVALIQMPDKDPFSKIGETPVFNKFQEQYLDVGLDIVQFVGLVIDGDDDAYIGEMTDRLNGRSGKSKSQRALDLPKLDPTDLLLRRSNVVAMEEIGLPVLRLDPKGSPETSALVIADRLIMMV